MIHSLEKCPYCEKGELSFDSEDASAAFGSNGDGSEPCEHLVYGEVCFTKCELRYDGSTRAERSDTVDEMHPALVEVYADVLCDSLWDYLHGEKPEGFPPHIRWTSELGSLQEERSLSEGEQACVEEQLPKHRHKEIATMKVPDYEVAWKVLFAEKPEEFVKAACELEATT